MGNSNSNLIPLQQPPKPTLSPQIEKDLEMYLEAMQMLEEARQKLKAMAAGLSHMQNVMYGVMEIMNMFQEIEGGQVNALSAIDNIDSDLRSEVTDGQNAVNGMNDNSFYDFKSNRAQAQKLIDFVNEMQAFIDAKGGAKGVIDGSTLKNLQDAINNIKSQYGTHWGNPQMMATDNAIWIEDSKQGGYPAPLKNILNGFQTLTQTTSALSTTTNTNLQYTTEMLKQFLGIENTSMQAYQKLNAQFVQNQRSS